MNRSRIRRSLVVLLGALSMCSCAAKPIAVGPTLLAPDSTKVVNATSKLEVAAPNQVWDFSRWDSLLVKVRNDSNQRVTVWARAENPDAKGTRDTVRNACEIDPKAEKTLRLRLTRRPTDPTYEPFKPFFMYYSSLSVRDNTIDPTHVAKVVVWVDNPSPEQSVTVESVKPYGEGVPGPVPFFPFIDRYGQYKHADWPGKIYSDADFKDAVKKDQADLASHAGPSSWDEYGGWKDGPKQEATGFFYTKKIDGKWWMVNPIGNLFWSYGPTGVSFGGNGGPVTDKESWFEELPAPDGPYAKYWSSSKGARFMYYKDYKPWKGFSFFALNMERKYGPDWLEATADTLHPRLRNWGFNSMGMWSNPLIYLKRKTPYCVGLHPTPMLLNHMPDAFDDAFAAQVNQSMEKQRGVSAGDPWCYGYFVDNELIWGPRPRGAKIVDGILAAPAKTAAKKVLQADLIAKYKDISALNEAWQTQYASWDAFMEPTTVAAKPNAAYEKDAGDFGMKFAERYFSVIRDAVKRVAPNQLYLGCRFNGHIDGQIMAMAGKYCDVISYNLYELPARRLNTYNGVVDKPFIVGEFGVGTDRVQSPWRDPKDEAANRIPFMRKWLNQGVTHPNIVGAHFFQFQDQAISGRPDGEALLRGFVDVTNTPHFDLVQLNREIGYDLYNIRSSGQFPESPANAGK